MRGAWIAVALGILVLAPAAADAVVYAAGWSSARATPAWSGPGESRLVRVVATGPVDVQADATVGRIQLHAFPDDGRMFLPDHVDRYDAVPATSQVRTLDVGRWWIAVDPSLDLTRFGLVLRGDPAHVEARDAGVWECPWDPETRCLP